MLKRLIECQTLQNWADRFGLHFWESFLIWRHDFSTRDKMRRVFGRRKDPFIYTTSTYEKARFDAMEAILQDKSYADILEVGCAEGAFTQRLISLAGHITAVDISAGALERAKASMPSSGVNWVQANIRSWEPPRLFDLILLADVAYYLGAPQKGPAFSKAYDVFCSRLLAWTKPSGRILVANGYGTEHDRIRNQDYSLRLENRGLRRVRESTVNGAQYDHPGFFCSIDLLELP